MTRDAPLHHGVPKDMAISQSKFELLASTDRGRFIGGHGVLHVGDLFVNVYDESRRRYCHHDLMARRVSRWDKGDEQPVFFEDEAAGLALGLRPCWSCRYEAWLRFAAAWEAVTGEKATAAVVDERLATGGNEQSHVQPWLQIPAGALVIHNDLPRLVLANTVIPWSMATGYGQPSPRPVEGEVTVLTPMIVIEVLRAGYRPEIGFQDDSATEAH